jgi:hypothetical protein
MTSVVHEDTKTYYGQHEQVPKNVKIVQVHSTVTTIKPAAFRGYKFLTSIIPKGLTAIGHAAYKGC